MNRDFDRDRSRVANTEEEERKEEVKNAVATGDNGEIRIIGRGSNRSNNEYEYYVVMRPVNRQGETKIRKVDKKEVAPRDTQALQPLNLRERRNRYRFIFCDIANW